MIINEIPWCWTLATLATCLVDSIALGSQKYINKGNKLQRRIRPPSRDVLFMPAFVVAIKLVGSSYSSKIDTCTSETEFSLGALK